MTSHTITAVQQIPASVEAVWDFFSDPANLRIITPEYMNFRVISQQSDRIYTGQIIEYKVSPLWGVPLYWMTEIREVKEKILFIDEQRKGPYTLWHHEHRFREIPGGVEMTDIVQYKNPGWIAGRVVNRFFIRSKLRHLFEYRARKTEELFGKWPGREPVLTIH